MLNGPNDVQVAGVGMIPFTKPGRSADYGEMGETAARAALADAGVDYSAVQQAYVGYVYGDSTSGQAALYGLGQTGIPVVNVNNNCSTGSSALWLARQAVASGAADCVLALGFEQMEPGRAGAVFTDRPGPMARFERVHDELAGPDPSAPCAAQFFGGAGAARTSTKYGTQPETFAKISVKARKHAANNPYAVFRDQVTVEEVLASPQIYGPLTRLQCCPPTCGAAAAVVCTPGVRPQARAPGRACDRGAGLTTDTPSTFEDRDMRKVIGYDMTAGRRRTGLRGGRRRARGHPGGRVARLLHHQRASRPTRRSGLTPDGTAEKFIRDGDNTYGGRVVTNPSGGLLSKGHPLGATGLAQCAELVWQLRGQAGARQVEGVDGRAAAQPRPRRCLRRSRCTRRWTLMSDRPFRHRP